MASIISAVACPHCKCLATEDDYYKIGEKFIWCYRCGYTYARTTFLNNQELQYLETENPGYGKYVLLRKQGNNEELLFQEPLSAEEKEEFIHSFQEEDVDIEKSYFYVFEDNTFHILAGNPPEDFLLPFEEYKKKKEANNEPIIIPW